MYQRTDYYDYKMPRNRTRRIEKLESDSLIEEEGPNNREGADGDEHNLLPSIPY